MEIVNARKLKSYFLGDLAAAEAERLEEDCASDAELTEQANIVESELADDYLRGNLSAAERRRFEENYLTTEARRGKLRSAEYLWKIAAENQATAETSATSLWQTLFGDRRLLAFGGLAAIIFGSFFLVWLNSNKKPEIAKQENTAQSSNSGAKNENDKENQNANIVIENPNSNADSTDYNSQKSANKTSPKPTAAPEIKPTPKPSEPTVQTLATFILSPGTLRSEGEQFVKIQPQIGKINLRLKLPNDAPAYKNYRAVVQTADGKIVFTSPNLKSPNIFLPAAKLSNNTYIIFLEGKLSEKPAESVAEYTFLVRR